MQSYKEYFNDRNFLISFFDGAILLAIALIVQFFVSKYVTLESSSSVTDIILSNTRVYDVDGVFVYGSVVLTVIALFVALKRVNRTPFAMKGVAVFTLIRSVFVSLTHISPFPNHVVIKSAFFTEKVFNGIFNGNDLFFSGHTGIPFLLALMMWDDVFWRTVFLGFSFSFALIVLLGHLHYSIDVLSAFFITYSIFHICQVLFPGDWQLFQK